MSAHLARDDHMTKTANRRRTATDGRTIRYPGYEISRRCRKRITGASRRVL